MKATLQTIGITIGIIVLATAPALAVSAKPIGWATADAVAAQRVAGDILATRFHDDGSRAVYDVTVRTADRRLEQVRVDAHTAQVVSVRSMAEPGIVGEIEAP